ncbi:MAG: hypothetical protein ACOC0W_06230 [Desulfosalsimonas sp.]
MLTRKTSKLISDVGAINNLPLVFAGQILTQGILVYSGDENTKNAEKNEPGISNL